MRELARDVRRARRALRKIKRCRAMAAAITEAGIVPDAFRCDLIAGHAGEHRHRPLGQTEVVHRWT